MDYISKQKFLQEEGDNYFFRNQEVYKNNVMSKALLLAEKYTGENKTFLEIGCATGNNLAYLSKNGCLCYGIEPSACAVNEAKKTHGNKINVIQGTCDDLPFNDNYFDCVFFGFCLYVVDRALLFKAVSEADRVLKTGGILIIEDFDIRIPYKRFYKHHKDISVYKMDYSLLFLSNPQYCLVDKRSYSHSSDIFSEINQERITTTILYKDTIENSYIIEE